MKTRIWALLLCLVLVITAFAGCTQNTPDDTTAPDATQNSQDPNPEPDPEPDPVRTPAVPEDRLPEISGNKLRMYYDDQIAVSELNKDGGTVKITDQKPTSRQVSKETLDEDVIIFDQGQQALVAVGTGTAKVTVGSAQFDVSVEAAPISLFMITGHSIGAGQGGRSCPIRPLS